MEHEPLPVDVRLDLSGKLEPSCDHDFAFWSRKNIYYCRKCCDNGDGYLSHYEMLEYRYQQLLEHSDVQKSFIEQYQLENNDKIEKRA